MILSLSPFCLFVVIIGDYPIVVVVFVFEVFVVHAGPAQTITIANVAVRTHLYEFAVFKNGHQAHVVQIVAEVVVGDINVVCWNAIQYNTVKCKENVS